MNLGDGNIGGGFLVLEKGGDVRARKTNCAKSNTITSTRLPLTRCKPGILGPASPSLSKDSPLAYCGPLHQRTMRRVRQPAV